MKFICSFLLSFLCTFGVYAGQQKALAHYNGANNSASVVVYAPSSSSVGYSDTSSAMRIASGAVLDRTIQKAVHTALCALKTQHIVIIGTSAALVMSLPEAANFNTFLPMLLDSSTVRSGVFALADGISYAVGESLANDLFALRAAHSVKSALPTLLHGLTMAGFGFYLWDIHATLNIEYCAQASLISGAVLAALTTFSHTDYAQRIKEYFSAKIKGFDKQVKSLGKIIGVATVGAGVAAVAYEPQRAATVFSALGNYALQLAATVKKNVAPIATNIGSAIVKNAGWLTGYSWLTNAFKTDYVVQVTEEQ